MPDSVLLIVVFWESDSRARKLEWVSPTNLTVGTRQCYHVYISEVSDL